MARGFADLDSLTLSAAAGGGPRLHAQWFPRREVAGVTLAMRGSLDEAAATAVNIDQWMGVSPVYTNRMRRVMGIEGDDVPAIMKALQLDVGFCHEYMDVAYSVTDPLHGEFWLLHCGALIDIEPLGEAQVFNMCHTIEDPTFDVHARRRIRGRRSDRSTVRRVCPPTVTLTATGQSSSMRPMTRWGLFP